MSNYPAGAWNSPSAPWNQPDDPPLACPFCFSEDYFWAKKTKVIQSVGGIAKYVTVGRNVCKKCFTKFDDNGN